MKMTSSLAFVEFSVNSIISVYFLKTKIIYYFFSLGHLLLLPLTSFSCHFNIFDWCCRSI